MTRLYLVRHAKAGERRLWEGDDVERPLSKPGKAQAAALAARLAQRRVEVLLTSPYLRCVQTLEPLAALTGWPVAVDSRLCEGEPFEPMLDLLADVPAGTVMCSHGDIIPATIAALERRRARIASPPDWRKASVWILKRNKHGEVVQATCWPPPQT